LVSKVNATFKTYESDLGLDRSSRILELDYVKNYSSLYRTFATNIHTGISASGHQYTGVSVSVLLIVLIPIPRPVWIPRPVRILIPKIYS